MHSIDRSVHAHGSDLNDKMAWFKLLCSFTALRMSIGYGVGKNREPCPQCRLAAACKAGGDHAWVGDRCSKCSKRSGFDSCQSGGVHRWRYGQCKRCQLKLVQGSNAPLATEDSCPADPSRPCNFNNVCCGLWFVGGWTMPPPCVNCGFDGYENSSFSHIKATAEL